MKVIVMSTHIPTIFQVIGWLRLENHLVAFLEEHREELVGIFIDEMTLKSFISLKGPFQAKFPNLNYNAFALDLLDAGLNENLKAVDGDDDLLLEEIYLLLKREKSDANATAARLYRDYLNRFSQKELFVVGGPTPFDLGKTQEFVKFLGENPRTTEMLQFKTSPLAHFAELFTGTETIYRDPFGPGEFPKVTPGFGETLTSPREERLRALVVLVNEGLMTFDPVAQGKALRWVCGNNNFKALEEAAKKLHPVLLENAKILVTDSYQAAPVAPVPTTARTTTTVAVNGQPSLFDLITRRDHDGICAYYRALSSDKIALTNAIAALPPPTFEALVSGCPIENWIVPPSPANQMIRTVSLLECLRTPSGPGLESLYPVLAQVLAPQQQGR